MDDHKRYYDPRDLWPLLVEAGFRPSSIRCYRHKFGLNTFAVCRVPRRRRHERLRRDVPRGDGAIAHGLDAAAIERMATGLAAVRDGGGRLFVLGVGGSAAHASHAACDFRKLCGSRRTRRPTTSPS